ncbi:MAG: RNA polymerase sporulation sigma factor SigK [Clostridia bacterium]
MFNQLVNLFSSIMFFILHVTGAGSFPKALSAKDEKKYLELMHTGDENARKILIEHNLRLVAHVIKKYYTLTNDQEDLISIGTVGLIKAIDSFKPDKGIKLSSYASRCVENEVLMHFRSLKKSAGDVSLNEPIETDKNGNSLTIMDTMSFDEDIIDFVDKKIKCKNIYLFVEKNLDPREKEIIILRYGLYGKKPLTQREVALKLNLSRSYISRIEKKALITLRHQFD